MDKQERILKERFCDKYAVVNSNGQIVETFRTKQLFLQQKHKLNHLNFEKLRLADIDIDGKILKIYKVGDNNFKTRK